MTDHFVPGDKVVTKRMTPPGHVRTPWYLRGKSGVIERVIGDTGDPEALAYRGNGPAHLYRVRFTMAEIWGDSAERPDDVLDAEIFENWLEPA